MLRRVALVYLGFAIGHVSWKVFKIVTARRRVAEALANVDGWELHLDGRDYMQNMHRFHDWRRELFALKGWKRTIKAVGGPAPELNTIDPAVIRHILSDSFDLYTKSSRHEDYLVELMHEFLGDGGIFVLQHGQGPELDHPDSEAAKSAARR